MSDSVEEAKACLKIIEDEEKFKKIIKELEHNKIKSGDLIGFRIDGEFNLDGIRFLVDILQSLISHNRTVRNSDLLTCSRNILKEVLLKPDGIAAIPLVVSSRG